MKPFSAPEFIYGSGSGDDAGVFKLSDGMALVQTVDFFTPIVDDPYRFGRIGAANSLSDVYALAARPLTALNILAAPCSIGPEIIGEILRGGADAVREAGALIVGGHSLNDNEPKYGLAVTGLVDPAKMITQAKARPGDVLILTKKIGVGIIAGTMKRYYEAGGQAPFSTAVIEEAETAMMRLNRDAAAAMAEFGASACTDVSGFGLLGHTGNMAESSNAGLALFYSKVPKYDGLEPFAIKGSGGGGSRNNEWIAPRLSIHESVTREQIMTLCDAQTSGGLLIAIDGDKAGGLVQRLKNNGDEFSAVIGEVTDGPAGSIAIRP
ncbi:MAG: selenide, water dikinase SelD [Nitrospinae bacterium]|nr:selenide, water dikinase SelD [Nitrospinota bacterium]